MSTIQTKALPARRPGTPGSIKKQAQHRAVTKLRRNEQNPSQSVIYITLGAQVLLEFLLESKTDAGILSWHID